MKNDNGKMDDTWHIMKVIQVNNKYILLIGSIQYLNLIKTNQPTNCHISSPLLLIMVESWDLGYWL